MRSGRALPARHALPLCPPISQRRTRQQVCTHDDSTRCAHCGGLARFLRDPRRHSGGAFSPRRAAAVLFSANFVGVACARSLHFQFCVWWVVVVASSGSSCRRPGRGIVCVACAAWRVCATQRPRASCRGHCRQPCCLRGQEAGGGAAAVVVVWRRRRDGKREREKQRWPRRGASPQRARLERGVVGRGGAGGATPPRVLARWPGGQVARWPGGQVTRWPGGQVARWPAPTRSRPGSLSVGWLSGRGPGTGPTATLSLQCTVYSV